MGTDYQDRRIVKGGDEKKAGANLITVRGIVIPVNWDEKGNAVAVAVSTHDEDEYLIDIHEKGEELLAFIREEVEVSGILREEGNRQIITVKEYRSKPGLGSADTLLKKKVKI